MSFFRPFQNIFKTILLIKAISEIKKSKVFLLVEKCFEIPASTVKSLCETRINKTSLKELGVGSLVHTLPYF